MDAIRHRVRVVIAFIDDENIIAPHGVAIIRSGNGIISNFFSFLAGVVLSPLIKGHRIVRDLIVDESVANGLSISTLEDRRLRRFVLGVS